MVRDESCASAVTVERDVGKRPDAVDINGGRSVQDNAFKRDPLVVLPNDAALAGDLALKITQDETSGEAVEGDNGPHHQTL